MFQHLENDSYWHAVDGVVANQNPNVGNLFIVFHPDGRMEVKSLDGLLNLYNGLRIPAPF